MKLILDVPTEKISGPGWTRFECSKRMVDVVYLTRMKSGLGWRYYAAFDHPDAHPEAIRTGTGGLFVQWVRRADHPLWRPPAFPDGAYSMYIRSVEQAQ